jgi:hypothetical protein
MGLAPSGDQVVRPAPMSKTPAPSLASRLENLSKLHADGVLTDEEYRTAKRRAIEG